MFLDVEGPTRIVENAEMRLVEQRPHEDAQVVGRPGDRDGFG